MAQNPKYDNDMVNLGYLNKRLGQTEESINKNNSSISQIPKNYSTPPNPPYYKDSLLCYGNKIYRCNKTKMNGNFSWNDWTVVATDDTTISDFINNTYEVEKLEIQEQIDGKIQTHYQDNNPSKDWTTDLEKGRHVGDYWYNTSDNTQWRYNQITTGPTITYGWGQVNIPKSVFDTIDRKKSIYTEKPTSYKKDDLWIIEETLSNDDLPIGTDENPIAKGDWVFSIADSEVYNKEHWVKRDEDVSLSYLEQHYYTITEIDSNLEVIERNTESKITKATEEISLNVSQTYTTKDEHASAINDFDEQIGTINQTITEHKETLSDLSVEVGEVSASVSSVETRTEELLVDVNGVKENIIPTATATGSNIYVDDASDNPLIQLEIEGKSTQETRSGKNKFDYDNYSFDKTIYNTYNFIEIKDLKPNTTYSFYNYDIDGIDSNSLNFGAIFLTRYPNYNQGVVGSGASTIKNGNNKYNYVTFTTDNNGVCYLAIFHSSYDWDENKWNTAISYFKDAMFNEGTEQYPYEPYGVSPSPDYPSKIESVGTYNEETGKYGIEVETVGRNLFNIDSVEKGKYYDENASLLNFGNSFGKKIDINANEKYGIYIKNNYSSNIRLYVFIFDENNNRISSIVWGESLSINNTYTRNITLPSNAKYIAISILDIPQDDIKKINIQLEKGGFTSYQQHQSNTLLIVLDQPLRSLPNGTKDIAYIRNNKLYIDRYVGNIVLNGSESWVAATALHDGYMRFSLNAPPIKGQNRALSNYFKIGDTSSTTVTNLLEYRDTNVIFINTNVATNLNGFKTWLSTHNTQVDYELATPVTEELGEIEIPSTFKGVNHITTTDELEPTINIEYVRDTTLSNYVEGQINKVMTIEERHYSELVIEDNSIKASVTEINSNISDMTEDIHAVQETLTSTEKTIEIISTNIDKTTGEIREVTTINGYKFNKDGLNIYTNENSFNTLIDNEGTYYKDGDTIISETTKDGFMATNIKNKGGQEYCYDENNKVYEFVKERIEVDGEYGYATFYNGVN